MRVQATLVKEPIGLTKRTTISGAKDTEFFAPDFARFHDNPDDQSHPQGLVDLTLDNGVMERCDAHDFGDFYVQGKSRISRSRIWNIGWKAPDRPPTGGHGFSAYIQGECEIADSILMASFAGNVKFAGSGEWKTPKLIDLYLHDTGLIGGDLLLGAAAPGGLGVQRARIVNAGLFDCRLRAGLVSLNETLEVRDSLFAHQGGGNAAAITIGDQNQSPRTDPAWAEATVTGNTVIAKGGKLLALPAGYSPEWKVDKNIYYATNPNPFLVWLPVKDASGNIQRDARGNVVGGYASLTFKQWQQETGFDLNSAFIIGQPDEPVTREYAIEDGARDVVTWGQGIIPADAPKIYPVDLPLNWQADQPAPIPSSQNVTAWREVVEPVETDEQKLIRELTAERDEERRLKLEAEAEAARLFGELETANTTIDQREQVLRERDSMISDLNTQLAKLMASSAHDSFIAAGFRSLVREVMQEQSIP